MHIRHSLKKYSHYLRFTGRTVIFSILFVCIFYILFVNKNVDFAEHPHFVHLQKLQQTQKSEKCVIPSINPWDQSILQYYIKQRPLVCKPVQAQLVTKFANGILKFDKNQTDGVKCFKISITHEENVSDSNGKYGEIVPLDFTKNFSFHITDEFFEINCELDSVLKTQVFKYHYAQVVKKDDVNLKNKKILDSSVEFPSVIMIGIDSMSRSNFIRQMLRTHKFMKATNFVDMKGHMKIHDNTYGNLLAILTGKRGVSVREFKAEMPEEWNISFDEFDMVWKNFSENGYVTLFAEDRPDIGTFNYKGKLKGFLQQPTDHYMRPFWINAFWSLLSRRSASSCYDRKGQHKIQLDYLEEFVKKYRNKRKFGFWWTQDMSHGFLNLIGKTDNDYYNFLSKNWGYLNDSIIYIFSDHGHRYDQIRETEIGRIESRMPMHFIRIPDNVQKTFPWIMENLKQNSIGMTTQFDVNVGLRKIAKGEIGTKYEQEAGKRSYSYFDQIPQRESCHEAGIPVDYCPCYSEISVPISEAQEASDNFMKIINDALENREYDIEVLINPGVDKYKCMPLEIQDIEHASVRLPMMSVIQDRKSLDAPLQDFSIQYHLIIRAKSPSNAILESTIEHDLKTGKWSSLGEIERNNKYGNTSFCVGDAVLKKICHCVLRSEEEVRIRELLN